MNTYIQSGNDFAQKAHKATHAAMGVANVAKSNLDKDLDDDSNSCLLNVIFSLNAIALSYIQKARNSY